MVSPTSVRRFLLSGCLLLVLNGFAQLIAPVSAQTSISVTDGRIGVRLRSFIPEAIASIYFEPSQEGGLVRFTALGLPRAGGLMPGARTYMLWAISSGEAPLRVGQIETDEGGNGGLEFARPPSFQRYAIVVTAESEPLVKHPLGMMVFASRAGAIEAQYGENARPRLSSSERRSLEKELRRSAARSRTATDFYSEVDNALDASPDGGRFVELVGGEVTPKARGAARLATHDDNLYLRTLIRKLPPASEVGASTYVLWGIAPRGRITYMGSFPSSSRDDADTYVRVAGLDANALELLVSAETRRPVASPSGRRALASTDESPEVGMPAFGAVEGQVLDVEGLPVAGATVEVRPQSETALSDNLPVTYTDERGRFFLDGLSPGEHVIYASKEEDGYPAAYQMLFIADSGTLSTARVENKKVTRDVNVCLGHKGALLKAHIVDARTEKPIRVAEVMLYREDMTDTFISFGLSESGEISRLVPSLPLKMKVVAPGYSEWHYGTDGSKEKAGTLTLEPDKIRELVIQLQPLN